MEWGEEGQCQPSTCKDPQSSHHLGPDSMGRGLRRPRQGAGGPAPGTRVGQQLLQAPPGKTSQVRRTGFTRCRKTEGLGWLCLQAGRLMRGQTRTYPHVSGTDGGSSGKEYSLMQGELEPGSQKFQTRRLERTKGVFVL